MSKDWSIVNNFTKNKSPRQLVGLVEIKYERELTFLDFGLC